MDKNFFKEIRILDGGMGQELLARGLNPKGTLWSAKALIEEKSQTLVENIHEDFVKAGAEVIVTNTFTTRRVRLKENNLEDKFEILNKNAGKIAKKIKNKFPQILIAGGLPPQNTTYSCDTRDEIEIFNNFKDQAKILDPYVDFFYLDVLSSIREISIAVNSINEFNKPFLIGAHISEGVTLPSGEKLSEITKKLGVNLDELNNEKVNIRLEKKLKMDIDLANKLGLRGTPAFVVGNEIIFGYVPANELLNKIN